MWSYKAQWPCVVVVFIRNRQETESDERTRDSMVRLAFCLWLAVRGFTLSQRQANSKASIGIFVRFPLASSAGRSAYTVGLLPPAAQLRKKMVYQLAAETHLFSSHPAIDASDTSPSRTWGPCRPASPPAPMTPSEASYLPNTYFRPRHLFDPA